MSLKITKITDKIEELDIKGQGCWDDCTEWKGMSKKAVDSGVGEDCEKSYTSLWWPLW